MKTITFEEDNDLFYMQDHSFYKGAPTGIEFVIDQYSSDSIRLIADGYGVLDNNPFGLVGKYGNGAIYVKTGELKRFLQGKVNDEEIEYLLTQ